MTITISLIVGNVLREELAKRGAVIRDRDIKASPIYKNFQPEEVWHKRIQEGKKHLKDVVGCDFLDKFFEELKKIHECGIILGDIKFGNVIIETDTGEPYLIDFEHSQDYSGRNKIAFGILKDRDIEKYNLHFSCEN